MDGFSKIDLTSVYADYINLRGDGKGLSPTNSKEMVMYGINRMFDSVEEIERGMVQDRDEDFELDAREDDYRAIRDGDGSVASCLLEYDSLALGDCEEEEDFDSDV